MSLLFKCKKSCNDCTRVNSFVYYCISLNHRFMHAVGKPPRIRLLVASHRSTCENIVNINVIKHLNLVESFVGRGRVYH